MTALGVFRDDFYNAVSALAQTQFTATAQASGVLAASAIAGAGDVYVTSSGATALTFDSAINIIAQVQIAVANAYKQGLGSFAAGVNPPPGVPNLFNVSYTLTVLNTNAGALTLSAGAGSGVTLTGSGVIPAAGAIRVFTVTITSPTTVTIQAVYASITATFTV
jgi:hypothetical protein